MPRWSDGLVDAFPVPEDRAYSLSLKKLTINDATQSLSHVRGELQHTFPFFDLPAELRNRIYNLVLFSKPEYRRADGSRRGSRLAILLASHRFHKEASYALYTTHKFLVFPLQEFTPLPTIEQLPVYYRILVTSLQVKIGSSWTDPPKSWRVTKALERCLKKLKNVQTLLIFVEFDPTDPVLKIKRAVYENYITFCGELVKNVLRAMPKLQYVQLDGNSFVDVGRPLVSRLRKEAEAQNKVIKWGREAGWAHRMN